MDFNNAATYFTNAISVGGGTLGITNGSFVRSVNSPILYVGTASGPGVVNQSGGIVTNTVGGSHDIQLGTAAGGNGTYNLSGGAINLPNGRLQIGYTNSTSSTFTMSGGSINVSVFDIPGQATILPIVNNSTNTFSQTAGTVTVGQMSLGGAGNTTNNFTTFTLTGGSFANTGATAMLAAVTNSILNITLGGSAQVTLPALVVNSASLNCSNTIIFDETTGYLSPTAATNNYIGGFSNAWFTANGANFNVPSGKDITVAQSFANYPAQAGVLTKSGAGVLALTGTNTYTGGTVLNAGTLLVNTNPAISTGLLTLAGGTLSNSLSTTLTNAINLSGNVAVSVLSANTLTLGGVITNNGTLTVNGPGTLILTNVNTYNNATTLGGGSLFVNSPGSIVSPVTVNAGGILGGNGVISNQVTVNAYGNLAPGSTNGVIGSLTLATNVTFTRNSTLTFVIGGTNNYDQLNILGTNNTGTGGNHYIQLSAISGIISNNVTGGYVLITNQYGVGNNLFIFAATGTTNWTIGTQTLTLTNSANGVVLGTSGDTSLTNLTWKGNVSGIWDINTTANWLNGGTSVNFLNGNNVTFDDSAVNFTVAGTNLQPGAVVFNNTINGYTISGSNTIAGGTTVTKLGTNTVTFTGASTYTGGTLISAGTVNVTNISALGTGAVTNNSTLNLLLANGSTYTSLGGIVTGSGTLNIALGTGSTGNTISGNLGSYTGVINIGTNTVTGTYGGGKINLSGAAAGLPATAVVNVFSNATLYVSVSATHNATLMLYGGTVGEVYGQVRLDGSSVWAGPVTIAGAASPFTIGSHLGGTISGPIGEANGAQTLSKGGDQNLTLTGTNTYTGSTIIGGTSYLTIGGSGRLGGVSGQYAGSIIISNTTALVYGSSAAQTFSGGISGAGSLINNGLGLLTLTGTNTYTGVTVINGGTLLINGNSSGATNTWTLSNAGSTLGGVGIIGGAVTAPANTVLAPGNLGQAGTLTLTNGLTLTSGYLSFILTNQTASAYSQLFITNGAFSANGTSQIRLYPATGVISNGTYVLITNIVNRTGAGTFVFAASGATNWNLGGATLTLTTNATSVVLNVTGGPVAYDVWSGTQSGTWDTTTANWNNGYGTYTESANVFFDDSATLFTVTNLSPYSPQPGSVTFNNSSNNYTIGAAIGGTATVTLNGTKSVTLTGVNTNTGGYVINAGNLIVTNGGAINTPTATLNILGGTNTLAGGSITVQTLLATNNSLTFTNSTLNLNGGTLVTSNNVGGIPGLAANILVSSNVNFNLNASWTMNAGTSYTLPVVTNAAYRSVLIGSSASVSGAVTVNSNAVWFLGTNVIGASTNFGNLALIVGNSSSSNQLVVNGGVVTNIYILFSGDGSGCNGNQIIITNGGQVYANNAANIGYNAHYNSLVIMGTNSLGKATFNGGYNGIANNGRINIGASSGGNFNTVIVGQGGLMTNTTLFTGVGSYNTLLITNGGVIYSYGGSLGRGVNTNNLVVVTGADSNPSMIDFGGQAVGYEGGGCANSLNNGFVIASGGIVTNVNQFQMAGNAAGDTNVTGTYLIVTNGGKFYTGGGSAYLGYTNTDNNNWIYVGGALNGTNALWSVGTTIGLTIGGAVAGVSGITGNTLTVGVGGVVTNGSSVLTIGYNGNCTNNGVIVNGGSLYFPTVIVNTNNYLTLANSGTVQGTTITVTTNATLGGSGTIGSVVRYQSGSLATFTVTPAGNVYNNSTYLTFTNQVYLTNVTVHLTLPTGLGSGTYVLATNYLAPVVSSGGVVATPVVDSGSYAPASRGSVSVSGNNLILTVTLNSTTTALVSSANPSIYGQSVTFTATVQTNSVTVGNATSNYVFSVNGTPVATNTLSSGAATYTASALTVGSYAIQAVYLGDANYAASTNSLTQIVYKQTPVVQTNLAATAITYGQALTNSTLSGTFTNIAGASIAGTLAFAQPTLVPNAPSTNVAVIFTPSDLTDYNSVTNNVTVPVNPAASGLTLVSSSPTNGYHDAVYFTATLPVTASGSVTFLTNGTVLSTSNLVSGVAISLTITNLPRGTNIITAEYAGDSNYLGSTNALNQIVTNHPPVAATLTVTRDAGVDLGIALSDIATNWTDVDGDPVSLTAVNLVSTNGINLAASNWVYITNGSVVTIEATNLSSFLAYTNGPSVADQLSYSISDGQGGTNVGYINIVLATNSLVGTNSIASITNGNPTVITAYGVIGASYATERATNLAPAEWVILGTNAVTTNGVITVSDYFGDLGSNAPSQAYYRLRWVPKP